MSKPAASRLQERLVQDETRAARILQETLCQAPLPHSAWAAVYAKRLGIKYDEACAANALSKGAASEDPLLQALCLRWLATIPETALHEEMLPTANEPVVAVMLALALAARGSLSNRAALSLPAGTPEGPKRNDMATQRVRRLQVLASPFDKDSLSLALAFVEARRGEWVVKGDDGTVTWAAETYRNSLIAGVLSAEQIPSIESIPLDEGPTTEADSIGPRLENRLIAQPRRTLHQIAMTGAPDLRIEALRAIAVAARRPEAGDFAACAAAFESEITSVRIEGARTFLMLMLRIRD